MEDLLAEAAEYKVEGEASWPQ